MARPSSYSEEIADRIVERLQSLSLRQICEQFDDVPDRSTIHRWQDANPDFATKCARASKRHAQTVLDSVQNELLTAKTKEAAYVAGVKMSHAQWYASKLEPKQYGDKLDLNHSGEVAVKRVVADV